ncbi:MAG TPA: FHA domain-containing protein [Tepidisphaeraceae bacterium]|nr:FHA domain-containing protein [Tepidisphaeraceae bacterium]
MAGQSTPRKHPPSPNGAPTLTPLGHYAGRPDIAISRQVTVVGSKSGSRLHLASSTVSQSHALIVNSTAGPYVRDLASRTHVHINGKDRREADLKDGDLLQIGKFKFQFNAGVPGAGLELGRDMREPAPDALLNVEGGEMPIPIEARSVLIGRRPTCDIPLIEDSVSTAHAVIFEMNGKRFIRDLGSRTGTFVNGQRINQQAELKFGDQIRIGDTTIGYASATGESAYRGDDDMDHLVSTAPLGTDALETPRLDGEQKEQAGDEDDAIPMGEESKQAEGAVTASAGVSAAEAEAPAADQVRLENDLDHAGPGDTAVLPAQAEKPRKTPTLKAPVEAAEPEPQPVDQPAASASAAAESTGVVDDVLGLTPEAREREAATIDELSASRRGWRGMQADEARVIAPATDRPAQAETSQPQATPETPAPPAAAPAEEEEPAPAEPVAEVPARLERDEPAVDTLSAEGYDISVDEPAPLAAAEPEPSALEDELHLPPVVDEVVDEMEVEPLPLTPEEGAPLDLSVEEEPVAAEQPAPALELKEPQQEEEVASAPELVAEQTPAAQPAPESDSQTGKKGKRKRAAREPKPRAQRKAKGAEKALAQEQAVAEAPAEPVAPEPPLAHEPLAEVRAPKAEREPQPAPEPSADAPPVEPLAEEQRDAVEVFDQTQPTPESALDENAVADMLSEPLAVDETADARPAADLTDTGFSRDVDSFVGESTGPLVEARDEEVAPEQSQAAGRESVSGAQDALASGPRGAEAEEIDDLLGDMLPEAPAEDLEAAAIDADIEELDLAIEEAAGDAHVADDRRLTASQTDSPAAAELSFEMPTSAMPQADERDVEAAAEPEPVADAPEPVADAPEPVADAPEHLADAPEPVADAPEPREAPLKSDSAARTEAPKPPPSPAKPATPAQPASPVTWGPNQEHFLGGMPLKLNKPVKPAGSPGNAGAAAARQGSIPQPPPRATRPNARTRSPWDIAVHDAPVEDLGTSIPPFSGKSPKKGQITTGFDGLAMPPVRETDVFSQMAPSVFAAGLAPSIDEDEDIFSRGARLARQQQQQQPQQSAGTQAQQPPAKQPPPPPQERSGSAHGGTGDDGLKGAAADETTSPAMTSPADAVWTDGAAAAEEQPAGAGAAPRRNRPLPTPPVFAPADGQSAPAKRKRRWFGLRLLLIAMLILAGGAAGGIYGFVKKQTTVVGHLRFDNFPSKTIERQALLAEQKKVIESHQFREAARKLLAQRHPDLGAGFLADPIAWEAATKNVDWAADTPNHSAALAFTYNGRDEHGDKHRVLAVLLALYDANTKSIGGAGDLRTTLASLNAARAKSEQRVAELKANIDRLGATALQMPDRKRIEELTAEANRLEKEQTAAARRVLEIKADLERMQAEMPANPQPAGTAQAPVVDPELSKLQLELDAANQTLAAGKAARAKVAEEAQVALDSALESFQKQVAEAQAVAKDNPELSAYLVAAEELQAGTRDLTDKLIRRQQEQQRRLAEMKTRLAEKYEAKRADTWKRDPELQKLGDELAIAQRQLSAAENGGAPKAEVAELKSHVSLLEEMIKARQTLVGDDQFYADAINQLQKFIDETQQGIDADRRHTEAELEKMQAAFARSQPAVEKMPAAQRELAASLGKQLEEINAARKEYNLAADAVAGGGEQGADEEMKRAEAAAAALAAQIDTRRKDIAAQAEKAATAEQEQSRLTALKKREAELASAQEAAAQTRQAMEAAQKDLRAAQATEAEAREAGERRDALARERDVAQKELEAIVRQLELKRSQASSSPEPLAPTEADVETTLSDPRPTYALASVGGIVALFAILMLVAGSPGAQPDEPQPPVADLAPFEPRPLPTPQPVGGNGAATQPQMGEVESRLSV